MRAKCARAGARLVRNRTQTGVRSTLRAVQKPPFWSSTRGSSEHRKCRSIRWSDATPAHRGFVAVSWQFGSRIRPKPLQNQFVLSSATLDPTSICNVWRGVLSATLNQRVEGSSPSGGISRTTPRHVALRRSTPNLQGFPIRSASRGVVVFVPPCRDSKLRTATRVRPLVRALCGRRLGDQRGRAFGSADDPRGWPGVTSLRMCREPASVSRVSIRGCGRAR
jgi:hypothetical protein